jgi:hypothetical protein
VTTLSKVQFHYSFSIECSFYPAHPLLQRKTDLSLQLKKGGASSGDISWCASSRSGVALRARPDPQVHQLVMLQSSEKSSSENPVQKRATFSTNRIEQ